MQFFTLNFTKMDINFHTIGTKSMWTNVVITIILWKSIHTKMTMGSNLCMEWIFFMEWTRRQVKIHLQHMFDNLLVPILLFPWFLSSNPILRLELVKEVHFPYYQPSLLDIWVEINHIWDLFDSQFKIRDYCIEQFKCLDLKLQEQECIKHENIEKKVIIQELTSRGRLPHAKRLPFTTTCQIANQRNWAWGIFLPPSKQRIHSTFWTRTTFVLPRHKDIWNFLISI